ncbi:SIR2 family NAD-dependent protein deacylase [Chitinophaga niabensis]|uniref:SIR2-like domain-containing protein n=1 Tax=Chitinophaga niabensis TaxID=536979 RepID=A0A1N6FBL2_9BACT|nr:SIR2 family protein [Chitinophaga niabensis]SIN92637.1 SIR2-like domain-containing protein [Chitinophaga niabensis]
MSVLDKIYSDRATIAPPALKNVSWCEKDNHNLYEYFVDFNEWIDGDDGVDIRIKYEINGLSNPSKAFFVSDLEAYNQLFKVFRNERKSEVLSKEYIRNNFTDEHWYERNIERFEQLENCLIEGTVVPFIGAGLSVESGFPTWKAHLIYQGRTCGLDADHVLDLLNNGHYETVIEEIESSGHRDAFIQEIKDAFSRTGKITQTTLRLTELFTDTLITTNYDHILQQAYDTGEENRIQLLDSTNIQEIPDNNKLTIIKLHGDIRQPANCIISKSQYNDAYGNGNLDLSKPIPRVLSYHYRTSNLLFLGCSLNRDRTMEVFQAVKDELERKGDIDRPQHFSLEAMPDTEAELTDRNSYLLKFGITPIWFPKGNYDCIEQILRLARNEMRYRGYIPGIKKQKTNEPTPVVTEQMDPSGLRMILNGILKLLRLS